ncbi:MAG: hypothetical protein A2017_01325 [Lentisphaerae bacterium GWF2_44_16]|nr:MAG: hypothetical protein A2017_01325 [Lentisphaerae bacterium GWF2_44_16]
MKKIFCLVCCVFFVFVLHAENLLVNPEFKSSNQQTPDKWEQFQKVPCLSVFSTQDGILRISEKSPSYANMISQRINIDGTKSYYFEVEYKADALPYPAGVYYYFFDEKGTRLKEDYFALKTLGPQQDWQKITRVISIDNPVKVKGIRLSFVSYSKGENSDNAIYFRNPVLTEYKGQKIQAEAAVKSNSSDQLPDNLFTHNLTNTQSGVPYKLEKGQVGFLRFDTPKLGRRRNMRLNIQGPENMVFEAYFYKNTGLDLLTPVSNNKGNLSFDISSAYNWVSWGNMVLFTAGKDVPEKFNLQITLTAVKEKKSWSFSIPVEQIQSDRKYAVPKYYGYYSWHVFPLGRIDLKKCGPLAERLKNNWENSGWKQISFSHIARVFPTFKSHYSGGETSIPLGVNASGAPTELYCDSALLAGGTAFFIEQIKRNGKMEEIKNYTYVLWDYEPYCAGPVTISCFCDACIKNFTKDFHLPANLSGIEILQKYESQWVKFRCRQRAETVHTAVKAIKSINPNAKFMFCSMPLPPQKDDDYFRRYGIDLRLFDDFVDIHTPMNYGKSLDFYRSIEREAKELHHSRMTIISNGWGDASVMDPKRMAIQMLAAFFCDNQTPFIGQGLFIAQGDQVKAIKEMMTDVAQTEENWGQGNFDPEKIMVKAGFKAEKNLYSIDRKTKNGKKYLLLLNNDDRETIFAKICPERNKYLEVADLLYKHVIVPEKDEYILKLYPLSYRIIELSAQENRKDWKREFSKDNLADEEKAINNNEKLYRTISKNGITCRMTPDEYHVMTLSQSLIFSLKNSAQAEWKIGKKTVISSLGRDSFMPQFQLKNYPATLDACQIEPDHVKLTLSYMIDQIPYDGLIVRKSFIVYNNKPEITVDVAIIPENGFRQFRYRTTHVLAIGKELASKEDYAFRIEYQINQVKDNSGKTVSYIREGAKFPEKQPFFPKYVSEYKILIGDTFVAKDKIGAGKIILDATGVDQLFLWRIQSEATLETIYPDAYPVNDPHTVKTWEISYVLKYEDSSK